MAKKIIVESKNGASNIDKSRQATNQSNLEEDKKDWQKICQGDRKNKVIKTLRSRLEKNYEYYGFQNKDDIDFEAVQRLARAYLQADPWLQINYCRDSTRQSIDESVQTATLARYVNSSFQNIPNGKEVPFNGKIVSKKEAKGLSGKELSARSVDAVGQIGSWQVKIFQKYSKVSGSGQSHQTLETQNWLDQVKAITAPNVLFVAQLDGAEAESHIPDLHRLVQGYDNVFVGNSEQLIDWLINHTK